MLNTNKMKQPFAMPECPPQSSKVLLKHNKACSSSNIQMPNMSLILDQDLISKDETSSEYWNDACMAKQSVLWLPHLTESPEADLPSSSKSSNFTVEKLDFWKTILHPKTLTSQHSLRFSLRSATPKAESATVSVTHKVRVYPKNKALLFDYLSSARRGYNLAIAILKDDHKAKLVDVRRAVKAQVKEEWLETNRAYQAEIVGEAVRQAFKTRSAIIQKRKRGLPCDYKFQSIKQSVQSFIAQRLNKTMLGNFQLTEHIGDESLGKTTTITWDRGRWFVNAIKSKIIPVGVETQELRVCAIDPGVRTFATAFYADKVVEYGKDFHKDVVFPLCLRLDRLYSKRKLYLNGKPNQESQAFRNTMRSFQKRIHRLTLRIQDKVDDLHRRIAHDLFEHADVVLLPKFETQPMSAKLKRKINAKSVRAMLGLKHYQFQQTMIWHAKKHGKSLIVCNEAWTSKTASWTGELHKGLGSSKIIKSQGKVVSRDINGARGVLLRALTKGLAPFTAISDKNVAIVA